MSETTIDLPVLGMTCAACVRRVERAIAGVPGVTRAEVNLPLSRARIVTSDDSRAGLEAAAAAIRSAGYEVPADVLDAARSGGATLAAIARAEREEVGGLRRDTIAAIALTVPLVVLAMTDIVTGTPGVIAQLVLGSAVVLGPGMRYLRAGWIAIRHRSPDMNTLIALGATAAWLASLRAAGMWFRGSVLSPTLYFEAGAAIITFVMIGKLLESRARAQVSGAVRGLLSLAPPLAHRVVDGTETDVDAGALAPGDVIAVRPGERIAADGTVVAGTSALDESLLTGESLPVDKQEGSPVYAGTLNHHGALSVRVARAGADTGLARIAHAVEDAQGQKAPIARLADRVSAYFVPAVLAIAVGTGLAWWLAGSPAALERAIAVLVIACPCALGLATPAAVAVGTSRGAELGVLFAGGDALERASRIDVVCLDKTGTLTTGKPVVVGDIDSELLCVVASLEQASEHPLARAIVEAAKARKIALERATDVTVEPGRGITGTVGGHAIRVGTREFAGGEHSLRFPGSANVAAASVSYVSIDGKPAGALELRDEPSAGARRVIDTLRDMAIEPVMVTGDREAPARAIASAVGITKIHFDVRPTAKAAIVDTERWGGHHVAMVGDGVNDAPALAAAFGLARATMHTIHRNLVAAFAYNLVCIPIAAAGLASPMYAAAAMSLSSVTVLLSSLRLKSYAARGG